MRNLFWLVLVLVGVTLSGCGVDWFPAPDPVVQEFSFTEGGTNVNGGTLQTSNAVTLAITGGDAKISVSGDPSSEYSVNGGSYTASAGTVKDGDRVTVHHLAAAEAKGVVTTTLRVGNKSASFSTTTGSGSAVSAFSFATANLQVAKGTLQSSAPITVTVTGAAAPISVSGDPTSKYSINGGAPTNQAGTVSNGDKVVVSHTSASADNTTIATTLTIGDKSDTFYSSTGAVASETINASGQADNFVYTPIKLHLVPGSYTLHFDSGDAGYSLNATASSYEMAEYFYRGFSADQTADLTDGQLVYLVDTAPGAASGITKSTTVIDITDGYNILGTITFNVTAQ